MPNALPGALSYVGRFAPSPTGPLHFGSLLAALASYLDARAHRGRWLLRMEDIDPPREQPGAADAILRILDAYGLHWDGPVLYQHNRMDAYRAAIDALQQQAHTYYCTCSRQDLQQHPDQHRHCLLQHHAPAEPAALRIHAPDAPIAFRDLIQGPCAANLADPPDDFVILRRDGLVAYQLATAVDDAQQGITRVVRGHDLLDSTFRQGLLMRWLGHDWPEYAHLPVALATNGQKLSKQNQAPALEANQWREALTSALACLGQDPPPDTATQPAELLAEATARWALARIPRLPAIPAPAFCKPGPA